MKRFWRIAWNGLALVSAFLCVAVVVLWVRGYYVRDTYQHFELNNGSGSYTIIANMIRSGDGLLAITRWEQRGPQSATPTQFFAPNHAQAGWSVDRPPWIYIDVNPNVLGFDYQSGPPSVSGPLVVSEWALVIPYWFGYCTLVLLPAWWMMAKLSSRHRFRRRTPFALPEGL